MGSFGNTVHCVADRLEVLFYDEHVAVIAHIGCRGRAAVLSFAWFPLIVHFRERKNISFSKTI